MCQVLRLYGMKPHARKGNIKIDIFIRGQYFKIHVHNPPGVPGRIKVFEEEKVIGKALKSVL